MVQDGGGRERGQKDEGREGRKEGERKRREGSQVRWQLLPRRCHYMASHVLARGRPYSVQSQPRPSRPWAGRGPDGPLGRAGKLAARAVVAPARLSPAGRDAPEAPRPWQDGAPRRRSPPRTPGERTRKRLRSRPPAGLGNRSAGRPRADPAAEPVPARPAFAL